MAKRLVDTTIWDKVWYKKLTPELKAVWKLLIDRCDHAGFWEIDDSAYKYYIHESCLLTTEQILNIPEFKERMIKIEDKIFIPGFISFQYKGSLDRTNRVHKSVIERLELFNINIPHIFTDKPLAEKNKGLIQLQQGCKDKDKEKVMDKDKDGFSKAMDDPKMKTTLAKFTKIKEIPK